MVRYNCGKVTLRQVSTRCQHANCQCNLAGAKHGPYWYGYVRIGGVQQSIYFGKEQPDAMTVAVAVARKQVRVDSNAAK